jgi:ankyrin repeat protein
MMLPESKLIKLVGLIALPFVMLQLTSCAIMTPLTAAAKYGDVARINELLNEGAKVDEPNSGKWSATPLYWSLFECKFEAAELLLKRGANVNSTDSYGSSPLYLAVCCKNAKLSFIEHLIRKGADVNYKNKHDGLTSLHHASSSGSVGLAKLLIDKGADVNALDNKGTTPLILAVEKNSLPIAKLLLERGADVNLRDKHKKNAMSYAKGIFTKKKEMIQLLQNADRIKPVNKAVASIDTSQRERKTIEKNTSPSVEEQPLLQNADSIKPVNKAAASADTAPREQKTVEKSTSPSREEHPLVLPGKEIKRDGRFIAYDNGTVLDSQTNLMWAAGDNGRGINWANANSYCKDYRGGGYTDWRMPTVAELAGLYDSGKTQPMKLINHTSGPHWASETRGSKAAYLMIYSGKQGWMELEYNLNTVVLPVRFAK